MKKTEKTYTKTEEKKRDTLIDVRAARNIATSSGDDKNIITASQNSIETTTEAINDDLNENYLRNRIKTVIEDYSCENDIDIYSMSQLQWNAVLKYIYRVIFCRNGKSIIDYRNSELLESIASIYIEYCYFYNKSVSLYGYSYITNIDYSILNRMKNNKYRFKLFIDITTNKIIDNNIHEIYILQHPSSKVIEMSNYIYSNLIEKIRNAREHSLTDKTENGSVMSLALGKIEYSWIESAKEKIQVEMLENYRLPSDLLNKYSDN